MENNKITVQKTAANRCIILYYFEFFVGTTIMWHLTSGIFYLDHGYTKGINTLFVFLRYKVIYFIIKKEKDIPKYF